MTCFRSRKEEVMKTRRRISISQRRVRLVALLAVLTATALVGAGHASAQQTFYAANTAQLQAALENAGDGDVIQLAPTTYFLPTTPFFGVSGCDPAGGPCLPPWQPRIEASITILGSTSGASVIDGQRDLARNGEQEAVFEIDNTASVTISHVSMKNAVFGIDDESTGAVTLDHSTITGAGYAAFYDDGGGSVTMTNDTIAGNDVPDGPHGYGVEMDTGDLLATNVTIADNQGYGLYLDGGTAFVQNSILANNNGADCRGSALVGVASFDSDGSCASFSPDFTTSNSLNLGPLADNGGLSSTVALGAGSAAIAAGDPSLCPPDDQRDFLRLSSCDAGAFQANGVDRASNRPPVISGVPSDVTIEAAGADGAAYTYTQPTAIDDIDGTVPVECSPPSGSTFPLGDTTVTCTATDTAGTTASAHFTVQVVDTTPPTLTVPTSPIVTDATGPDGSIATYTATATDLVDGPVTPSCAPSSGSTFPIGGTTVTCTATDKHGNTSAPQSLVVHVKGAAEQLQDLVGAVSGVGPGRSFANKVDATAQTVADGDTGTACESLAAFVHEVEAQSGQSITTTKASDLFAAAERIEAVLGC